MRVWVYPEKTYEELGAERWEIEWQTVTPKALRRVQEAEARGEYDEIDIDVDLDWHHRHYATKAQAVKAARAVVNLHKTAFGSVTVMKQVVDWYVEEDRVAEWSEVGEADYID